MVLSTVYDYTKRCGIKKRTYANIGGKAMVQLNDNIVGLTHRYYTPTTGKHQVT
jgi:hypothetical protein